MLTQAEANSLIEMEKTFVKAVDMSLPPGTDKTHSLLGNDRREPFLLDLWRGTLQLSKLKYQIRGQKVVVLVRLDINGAPHTNPDRSIIGKTHLHIYREGYDDKWAYAPNPDKFQSLSNIQQSFDDFCQYCNIKNVPPFQRDLL